MKISIILLQLILFIVIAPFLSGLITKIKNNIRMRRGQSIFQPYYNLAKAIFQGRGDFRNGLLDIQGHSFCGDFFFA